MKRLLLLAAGAVLFAITPAKAVDDAYTPGVPGQFVVREIPEAKVLVTAPEAGETPADEVARGRMFRRLFAYIDKNDIPMTAPVEVRPDGAAGGMVFYLGKDSAARSDLKDSTTVKLITIPARTVATISTRGSYTEERYREAEKTLTARIENSKEWKAAGPAYRVYWSSPFMPGFLKKSEVHIPVTPVPPAPESLAKP